MKTIKHPLKNSTDKVVFDEKGYNAIKANKYLGAINFLDNLRQHSAGYAFFQRCVTTDRGPVYETIYLQKWLAEKFINKPKKDKRLFVRFINGNKLDVRMDNMEWVDMSTLRRNMRNFTSKTGYRGVVKEKGRYRAVLYDNGKVYNLGFHDTAEEAARAYNKKSKELFGITNSLNKIQK